MRRALILFCHLVPLSCATAPPATVVCPPASVVAPRPNEIPPPRCGNGIIDEGELCDPHVVWAERCPEPWGMCWTCAPACNAFVPALTLPEGDVDDRPFCERRYGGSVQTRSYDAFGRRTRDVNETGNANGAVHEVRYVYDDNGRLLTEDADFSGTQPIRSGKRYIYRDGQHSQILYDEDMDGETDRSWNFAYHEDGRLSRVTCTEPTRDNAVCSDVRYSYNLEGQWTAQVKTFPDSEMQHTHIRSFDAWGRQTYDAYGFTQAGWPRGETRTVFVEGGGLVLFRTSGMTSRRRIDHYGNVVASSYRGRDGSSSQEVIELSYDDHGYVVESRSYGVDGEGVILDSEPTVYSYDYDEHHNLVASYNHRGETREINESLEYDCVHDIFERMPHREFVERTAVTIESELPSVTRREQLPAAPPQPSPESE